MILQGRETDERVLCELLLSVVVFYSTWTVLHVTLRLECTVTFILH